ncbi:hypothetical protein [Zoogloea oleivorans]|uniref:hypothetical protein n=1 Tax=Zoogloea oleivorans TaxID=1552750 RepID=UPI00319E45B2
MQRSSAKPSGDRNFLRKRRWGHCPRPSYRRLGCRPHHTSSLHSLQRDGLKKGIVTLCIGGGQGIALALEVL